MVIKPSPTQLFLLEWGGGLFVCPLVERLTEYYQDNGRLITLRQLHLADSTDRNRIENKIEDFVDMLLRKGLGMNDSIPFGQVLQAAKKQNTAKDHGKVVVDDLNQLFCSKTVAVCYKSAGVIAASRDAAMFLPTHFSASAKASWSCSAARVSAPRSTSPSSPGSVSAAIHRRRCSSSPTRPIWTRCTTRRRSRPSCCSAAARRCLARKPSSASAEAYGSLGHRCKMRGGAGEPDPAATRRRRRARSCARCPCSTS